MAGINLIRALALRKGLDPAAVLAVARQEGLSGGIGDQGTSFGPFQLHKGGALPSGIPLESAQNWAWSPAGLNYALSRIASVAGGLKGRTAIENIVRRFERPANPENEISGALRSYGQAPSVGNPGFSPPIGSTAAPALNNSNLLLNAILNHQDLTNIISRIYNPINAATGLSVIPPTSSTPSRSTGLPRPVELLLEGRGGPTHSTGPHVHVAYTDPQAMIAAIDLANSLNLSVRENPFVDKVDPVHAKNSYHYRTFPGLYRGRKLGKAIDVSGRNAGRFYELLKAGKGA